MNQEIAGRDGLVVYAPYSCLDDEERREAEMFMNFKPKQYPQLEFVLRVSLQTKALGAGMVLFHEYGLEVRIYAKNSADYRVSPVMVDLDGSIIEKALEDGINPIEQLFLKQLDFNSELRAKDQLLDSYFSDIEIREISGQLEKLDLAPSQSKSV